MNQVALTNTLENPGEFDALLKLRPGEVYFLLIARDRLAPPLVDEWADRNRRKALAEFHDGKIDREKLELELRQSTQAEMIASDMRAYKAGWDADEVTGQASLNYTGHEPPEEQKRRDEIQRARVHAATALNGASAMVNDLIEVLARCGGDSAELADLANMARDVLGDMQSLSSLARPLLATGRPIG